MKICKYRRNTKTCQYYTEKYDQFCAAVYDKTKSKQKYSELSDKRKNKDIFAPISDIIVDTLSKKRKCAKSLYNHLFEEKDRIVLKLHRNRFVIYNFSIILPEVESYKMKVIEDNKIMVIFNNKTTFILTPATNSSEIKENISLKFHTNFKNIDEIFVIKSCRY